MLTFSYDPFIQLWYRTMDQAKTPKEQNVDAINSQDEASGLESKYVFIDTNIYESLGFHFGKHAALVSIAEAGARNDIKLLTTRVIDGEIRKHLSEKAGAIVSKYRTIKDDSDFLLINNSPGLQAIRQETLSYEVVERDAHSAWEEFLHASRAELVDIEGISISHLLDLYFNNHPPFHDKKKKSEFPDAIFLLALEQYAKARNNALIYVIANDKGVFKYCESSTLLEHIWTAEQFLDRFNSPKPLSHLIKAAIRRNEEALCRQFRDFVEIVGISNHATRWVNSRVIDHQISDLTLSVVSTLDIHSDNHAEVELGFLMNLEVVVVGPDLFRDSYIGRQLDVMPVPGEFTVCKEYEGKLVNVICRVEWETVSDGEVIGLTVKDMHLPSTIEGIPVCIEQYPFLQKPEGINISGLMGFLE